MMPTYRRRGEAGYTLIEMLVVLTIISLVAALAISRRPADRALQSKLVAARLEEAIVAGQERANATGEPVTIDLGRIKGMPAGIHYDPAVGPSTQPLVVYADGSSSGGRIIVADHPICSISWLDGSVNAS